MLWSLLLLIVNFARYVAAKFSRLKIQSLREFQSSFFLCHGNSMWLWQSSVPPNFRVATPTKFGNQTRHIHRFQIRIFWVLALDWTSELFNKFTKELWGFWMLLYLNFSFFPIHEKDGKLGFLSVSQGCFFKFFSFSFFQVSLKTWEIRIFKILFIHILLDYEGQYACKNGKEIQLVNKLLVFK